MAVKSVERALSLLLEIGREPGGLVDLSNRCDLPTSTAARLLDTLRAAGTIDRDADGSYRIGPEIRAIASTKFIVDLAPIARPWMVKLSDQLGEAVGLSVPTATTTTTRVMVQAPNPVQAEDWTGTEIPLHGGVIGLVTLATRTDADVEHYLSAPLVAGNTCTVTDPATIRKRLAQIRRGVPLWTHGEWVEDLSSVAAAVVDASGNAIGALYTYGPSFRFPPTDRAEPIGREVARTADAISREVSNRPANGARLT